MLGGPVNGNSNCINLRERFGKRYRITRDESGGKASRDPWYWIIPGKYGEIYAHGDDFLQVMVTSVRVANDMRGWPELTLHQDAEDAVTFIFRVGNLEKVATRIKARKRRQVSAEHMKNIGAATAYRAGKAPEDRPSRPELTPDMAFASEAGK